MRRYRVLAALLAAILGPLTSFQPVFAYGENVCQADLGRQAGELAHTGSYLIGARSTIEGQRLTLCSGDNLAVKGSFEWAAVQDNNPAYPQDGYNIVQVGYGHCLNVNNGIGLGTTCNGSYYWYWAWGSDCGGAKNGSGGGYGPIAIRIGSPMSDPPPTADFYVLRQTLGGIVYFSGFVNGQVLSGNDANGNPYTAQIRASSLCWDSEAANRKMAWFGETFDSGDSMGGWNTNGTANHLDYTLLRFSVNTGWLAPALIPGGCNVTSSRYTCTIATNDHIYIDSH